MTTLPNLSKEDRELVEDACAIYMAHHYPKIAAELHEKVFEDMRAAGETENEIRQVEKRLWDEVALQKSSPASGVTVLERGVVLRRDGVIVKVTENDRGGFDCAIERSDDPEI